MKMTKTLFSLLVLLTCAGVPATAQEMKEENTKVKAVLSQAIYKLDLAVYELQDGKKTNLRKYLMFVKSNEGSSSIKVGNRVPITTGSGPGGTSPTIQYMDVGLNLKCRISDRDGVAQINAELELASLVLPERASDTVQNPVVRQLREDAAGPITVGKPMVLMSIDDTNSPRTVQLEVTATKL
jgi:hypothetical protein